MSDMFDEWKVVRRGKCASRKFKSHLNPPAASCIEEHVDVGQLVKRIRKTVSDLKCEEFCQDWKRNLLLAASTVPSSTPDCSDTEEHIGKDTEGFPCPYLECVCYGLGSFSACVSARFQLAMLLLLLDAGKIPVQHCSVYDPAFSSSEMAALKELGFTLLTENEEGKRLVTTHTLFYLMHCGKALYNNLLWKNWSAHGLSLVTIIGNSFKGIRERSIERELKRDYSYISNAVGLCKERHMPCPAHLIDVFGDTALITFPSDLNKLPKSTWTDPIEPQYQNCSDLEIVLKKNSVCVSSETVEK